MYSLLKTVLTSVSRSIARSIAWRTRTSASALLLRAVVHVERDHLVPELGHADHLEPASPRISARSVGETRSIMCRSPERRLARRAVESVMGTNSTRSTWMFALVPVVGERARPTILPWATRSTNSIGPGAHRAGAELVAERLAPPWARPSCRRGRSARRAGARAAPTRLKRTVRSLTTSTLLISPISRLAERARRVHVALDVELHRLGVERLAVVELHAGPQLDHDRAAVRRPTRSRWRAGARS